MLQKLMPSWLINIFVSGALGILTKVFQPDISWLIIIGIIGIAWLLITLIVDHFMLKKQVSKLTSERKEINDDLEKVTNQLNQSKQKQKNSKREYHRMKSSRDSIQEQLDGQISANTEQTELFIYYLCLLYDDIKDAESKKIFLHRLRLIQYSPENSHQIISKGIQQIEQLNESRN
ncbi:hypothetical protein HZF13_05400 [Lactiplantibacillus plantarum]|uniref:hypothetical protein n=1 Tax=Lactiplantibacillus plantarum TaxID=1590 RepID=UPI001CA59709|nr:hypothetical protein [Lactiplantibacillus plantarum]QYC98877.1 hypothetical protein HZF13_05400 [Lactiplantibacillus plantarum]